jgi:hypothetical protein
MIGVAATSKVVTSANTIGRATTVQPGNREWVTTIECIDASGWRLPPFIILSGKLHQASWYKELPDDLVIACLTTANERFYMSRQVLTWFGIAIVGMTSAAQPI